jgi:GPI-anchor transamidase subunit T
MFNVPPQETVRITMDITKAFLRYTEHPPDAQRGWDLPPAMIVPVHNGSDWNPLLDGRIYTSALLVDLATPDFSMPYNVIIFTCSLVAFIFGSVFNLLTRRFVVVRFDRDKIQ